MTLPARVVHDVDDIDILNDSKPALVGDRLEQITTCGLRFAHLDLQIGDLEVQLKQLRDQRTLLEKETLPMLMESAGISSFKLATGAVIETKRIVAGSIPKEDPIKRAAAFKWLHDNGHSGLIKTKIITSLPKGEQAMSERVQAGLRKLGVEIEVEESVHPSTLGAWAREQLANGVNIPTDTLGLFVGNRATIKQPR